VSEAAVLIRGAGAVIWNDGGQDRVVDSPDITVCPSGLVVWRHPDNGAYHISYGIEAAITEVEYFLPSGLPSAGEDAPPSCDKCLDSNDIVAGMRPPRCPQCNRKAFN